MPTSEWPWYDGGRFIAVGARAAGIGGAFEDGGRFRPIRRRADAGVGAGGRCEF